VDLAARRDSLFRLPAPHAPATQCTLIKYVKRYAVLAVLRRGAVSSSTGASGPVIRHGCFAFSRPNRLCVFVKHPRVAARPRSVFLSRPDASRGSATAPVALAVAPDRWCDSIKSVCVLRSRGVRVYSTLCGFNQSRNRQSQWKPGVRHHDPSPSCSDDGVRSPLAAVRRWGSLGNLSIRAVTARRCADRQFWWQFVELG
jgi:hypothetical protein